MVIVDDPQAPLKDSAHAVLVVYGNEVVLALAQRMFKAIFTLPTMTQTTQDYRDEVFEYARAARNQFVAYEPLPSPPSRPWIRPAYQRAAKKLGPQHVRW